MLSFNVRQPLLSVLSAAAVLLALTAADNAKAKQAPFTAALTITETLTRTGSPCVMVGTINGSGLSSFGPVTLNSQDCIITDGVTYNFSSDNAVLQTAGGDTVTATYSGTGAVDPTTGALVLTGAYQFKKGTATGVFKKTSGCGNLYVVEQFIFTPPDPVPTQAQGFVVLTEGTCSPQ